MSLQRDLADSAGKINFLDNVTSDIQEQLTAAAKSGGGAAYAIFDDFTAPVCFKKVDIIPNNQTVVGTWEWFGDAELWVSELTTIASDGSYLTATESKSNHLFFEAGYIGDDATVTVTDTMQGIGDSPISAADAAVALEKTDFSATDAGGLGSFSYNNTTGVSTYTGPSLGKLIFLGGM
jgi:hypothetical protein